MNPLTRLHESSGLAAGAPTETRARGRGGIRLLVRLHAGGLQGGARGIRLVRGERADEARP